MQLSKSELKRNSKKYRRNPVKQKAYIDYENKLLSKGTNFETEWKNSLRLARRIFSFGRKETNKSLSESAELFIRDKANYNNSILERVEKATGLNIIEKFDNATFSIYDDRMKKFFDNYGNDSYTLKKDGKKTTKTLNEFFEDFKNGEFTKEEFNDLISSFQLNNEKYMSIDYSKRNYESRESTIEDYATR